MSERVCCEIAGMCERLILLNTQALEIMLNNRVSQPSEYTILIMRQNCEMQALCHKHIDEWKKMNDSIKIRYG